MINICSHYSYRSPNLQVLSIKSCPHVTDETMSKIASGCPLLKELDISFCYQISHKCLALIGQQCPNLRILRRHLMTRFNPSQQEPFLPREYLDTCPQDGDSEAVAIGKFMPQLVQLEIRFSKLTNKGLALISEGCINLEHLDLFGCMNVTSRDISNASSNLKQLKTLKKPHHCTLMLESNTERYGLWQLYDERFQTDFFRI
ncbi:F-box protein SKIP1-like [Lycium barbarum]|uniref:F-box protein SKIP1-like n=1 Tax=Lycium barbarum TaxID=112863 RepID=UPI00293E62EB|nr:F-box protein SKIP1-like [Lycium barbarum]